MRKIKLSKENYSNEVKPKKAKRTIWNLVLSVILIGAIGLVSAGLLFALYIVITSPDFDKQKLYQKEPNILYDINGDEFARVGSENSTVVTYDELPDVLIDALIATEDSRFFQHNGLDLFRFLKATAGQLLGKEWAGGASTLSMQVMKRTYNGGNDAESEGIRGIVRKFKDIYMAVFKLEANYTKEEIIEFYLNSQWLASDGNINYNGIYGVEQASLYYFGKSAKDLNLSEASLLVGMFQNPTLYKPYKNPEGCRNRQKTVLKLMVRHGYITEEQQDAVLNIPIESLLITHEDVTSETSSNRAFVDFVLDQVSEVEGLDPSIGGLKIYTTFDPKVQAVLERAENGEFYKYPDEFVREGIAVVSTENGSVVALSGGRDYTAYGTNYATDINRQPGSTAKPIFDYSMYIEHISQSTYAMLLDEYTTYSNKEPISDYDNKYRGLITMRYALEDSRNIPALLAFKEVYKLDPKIIENFVHSVGINYGSTLLESASIGGFNGVSPLEMAAAYATFGRGGYYIKPYGYTKVINTETGKEYDYNYEEVKVMEDSTAYLINNILIGVYGGRGPSGTDVGGKTGTTNLDKDTKNKYHLPSGAVNDAWIISYSPSYSIALWYGYDDLAQGHYITSNTGGSARRNIMNGLAVNIHRKNERFTVPKNVVKASIELETFPPQLCSEYTPNTKNNDKCTEEYFVKGTEPTEVSNRYDTLPNPTNGSALYTGSTIEISWDPIKTPDAINDDFLIDHFNTYYGEYAQKYYELRLNYNSAYIGNLVYKVYLKNSDGSLTELGETSNSSFTYNAPYNDDYTFVVKSSYTIFTANASSGLTISTRSIDNNVEDMLN